MLPIKLIKKCLPQWNKVVYSEFDGLMFCEKNKIITKETELIEDSGEYRFYRNHSFIFIKDTVADNHRSWVLFHEIGHYILHPVECAHFSDNVLKARIEREAHIIAAVALIPFYILETKTLFEIKDEFNYPIKLILFRKWVFDTYQI